MAGPEEVSLIRDALALHRDGPAIEALRGASFDPAAEPSHRLRASCALTALSPGRASELAGIATPLTLALLAEDRRTVPRWLELLGPALPALVPALTLSCQDAAIDPTTRVTAAEALAAALARLDDAEGLARAFVEARPDAAGVLLRALVAARDRDRAKGYLRSLLSERVDDRADLARLDALAHRQASAALGMAALGDADALWPRLRHHDDPRLRGLMIDRLARLDLPAKVLLDRLQTRPPDAIERQALLMIFAESKREPLGAGVQADVIDLARGLYRDDPDPGVHSAAASLLRRWGSGDLIARGDDEIRRRPKAPDGRLWRLGPNGHTFAVVRGPMSFEMGSPEHEQRRLDFESPRHPRRIDRSIEVATTEVTYAQFRAFRPTYTQDRLYGDDPDCPADTVAWIDAIAYCNWLSEKEGLEPCYPAKVETGMTLGAASVTKNGYRLPTEAEWEHLCRAGTVTARPFGETEELLPRYAWTWLNSGDRTHPVAGLLPNELGLFDMLGNVWEWCHDGATNLERGGLLAYPARLGVQPVGEDLKDETILFGRTNLRTLRGGSYSYSPSQARSAMRYAIYVDYRDPYEGFRVVRTIP